MTMEYTNHLSEKLLPIILKKYLFKIFYGN